MFKCAKCYIVTQPREPMLKVPTFRDDGSIAFEISICVLCATGKEFVSTYEKEYIPGFNGVPKKAHHNDRVQV